MKSQNSKKIQLDFNQSLNFVPQVPSFFFFWVPSELLGIKIEESKSN